MYNTVQGGGVPPLEASPMERFTYLSAGAGADFGTWCRAQFRMSRALAAVAEPGSAGAI